MELGKNHKIQEYIEDVCSNIRCREIHRDIEKELESHITELVEELVLSGLPEDEAVDRAIERMGDSGTVGRGLNKAYKQKPEWSVLALTLLFVSLGLAVIYFIESSGVISYGNTSRMFRKSLYLALAGSVIAASLYYFDYRKLKPFSKYIYMATLFISILTIFTGVRVNGMPWFRLGPVSLNFVGISVFLFALSLSGILDGWDWGRPEKFLQGTVLIIVPVIITIAYPSLSSAVICFVTFLVLMAASGAGMRYVMMIAGSSAALFIFEVLRYAYRTQRFLIFLNPQQDPHGAGYLNIQLEKLLDSAGLLGQGFTLKPGVIPEVHTDFVFSYIVYTFGWVAGIILIAAVIAFIVRIMLVSKVVKDSYGRIMTTGFCTILAVEFIWNILMTLGLAPLTGVSLPFISYGGTQFMVNMAMVGLISGIYRRRNIKTVLIL